MTVGGKWVQTVDFISLFKNQLNIESQHFAQTAGLIGILSPCGVLPGFIVSDTRYPPVVAFVPRVLGEDNMTNSVCATTFPRDASAPVPGKYSICLQNVANVELGSPMLLVERSETLLLVGYLHFEISPCSQNSPVNGT